MAYFSGRMTIKNAFRNVTYIPVRFCKLMNNPLDHATGIEKRELLAQKCGNIDPFNNKVLQRGAGTKDEPNEIPSCFDARLVGCICESNQIFVNWMWLLKDSPKRCECGHWFVLVEKKPL